jgi:hypothetical protein
MSISNDFSNNSYRLGTGNTLMMAGDLFGLGLNTTSEIVKECCKATRIHLKQLVFNP